MARYFQPKEDPGEREEDLTLANKISQYCSSVAKRAYFNILALGANASSPQLIPAQ